MSTLFQFWALMCEPGEREFVERPQQNQQPRDVDLKDIPKFEWKIQPNDFIDQLNMEKHIFDFEEVPDERKVKVIDAD